ncbi:VOC family protein [Frateuria hangzhouensis]|uniref:VOC family protein n=1 Tax=Frateuria hangzhouensis TaxID=2995589 RepID=UPI002260CB61|nr:VOC family protein [Frateuria sp. STR12]MCX7515051.1 VOC family protein [Frateuria sp. STR12]
MPSHKPADHPAVSPYLLVADARGMLAFLAATFGARELHCKTREDGSVMHAEVRIDDSVVMLGERPGGTATPSASTHVYVPDVDACHAAGLAAGASSVSPPTDQPYGDRTAGLRDAQGNLWWIGTHLPG